MLATTLRAGGTDPAPDLTQLSLEDLMRVKVTSVSRKAQLLTKAGAAVFVITREDIRRSGMTKLPELLRTVPGVDVARITANSWAVSIRGFNDRYSTKVLVLIDGRTIFTQEFSGVFWDQQTVPLEEIERIEVIRGPGGTVWGANAVNGVINIITMKSQDTKGALVSLGTGSQESAQGYARAGGAIGEKATYRFYGKYFNTESSNWNGGRSAGDGWNGNQFGFRTDWQLSANDVLTVQADAFHSNEGQTLTAVVPKQGFQTLTFGDRIEARTKNVLAKWNHTFANGSESSLNVFYNDAARVDQGSDDQDTADVDFQYHFRSGERQDIVTGFGYRHTKLFYEGYYSYGYNAPSFESNLVNGFIQDEVTLSATLTLTVGTKLERNSFTGFEYEPSAQLVWAPNERQSLWVSAARAIRQPSWFYANSILDAASFPLDGGGLGVFRLLGNSNNQAEKLIDFEIGYRKQIKNRLTLDLTAFRSYYHGIVTSENGAPFFELDPGPPHLVIPSTWENRARARNYGAEAFATWQATRRWRLSPGFSYLQMKVIRDASSTDAGVELVTGSSPKYQARLHSTIDLLGNLEWDSAAYYVSGLTPSIGGIHTDPIGRYTRVDTRLGWRFKEHMEFSLVGQNLLAPRRLEFSRLEQQNATPVQRSITGNVTWRF
ncbi:MAG: TonB-dependent receptor [Acidobacteriota bacterium]